MTSLAEDERHVAEMDVIMVDERSSSVLLGKVIFLALAECCVHDIEN